MPSNIDAIFVGTVKSPVVKLTTNTLTTLYTAGANGGYVGGIWVFADSSYSGGGNFELYINNGSIDVLLGERLLTASIGFNALDGVFFPGEMDITANFLIKVKATTVSAGNVYVALVKGGDY